MTVGIYDIINKIKWDQDSSCSGELLTEILFLRN